MPVCRRVDSKKIFPILGRVFARLNKHRHHRRLNGNCSNNRKFSGKYTFNVVISCWCLFYHWINKFAFKTHRTKWTTVELTGTFWAKFLRATSSTSSLSHLGRQFQRLTSANATNGGMSKLNSLNAWQFTVNDRLGFGLFLRCLSENHQPNLWSTNNAPQ